MKKVIFINPGKRKPTVEISDRERYSYNETWLKVVKANMVIVIDTITGETEIVKNRWGKQGFVYKYNVF